jgi:hypothetical protein
MLERLAEKPKIWSERVEYPIKVKDEAMIESWTLLQVIVKNDDLLKDKVVPEKWYCRL